MRRVMIAALATLVAATAACGPVPHPFAGHADSNPLVEDRHVVSTVRIAPVAAAPGLNAALVRELARRDVLAFTGATGPLTVTVTGSIDGAKLVWRLTAPDRTELGKVAQPIAPGADVATLARDAAPLIVELLTSDASRPDGATRAHVAVHMVRGPQGLDAAALTRAMADALVGRGLTIDDADAAIAIDGAARILPAGGNQDVLQIDWTVRDAKGASLGTVSQGSPVDRALLAGPMTGLARDIAAAAAPGVLDVIRRKAPAILQ